MQSFSTFWITLQTQLSANGIWSEEVSSYGSNDLPGAAAGNEAVLNLRCKDFARLLPSLSRLIKMKTAI
jgi:hypothetical protein